MHSQTENVRVESPREQCGDAKNAAPARQRLTRSEQIGYGAAWDSLGDAIFDNRCGVRKTARKDQRRWHLGGVPFPRHNSRGRMDTRHPE